MGDRRGDRGAGRGRREWDCPAAVRWTGYCRAEKGRRGAPPLPLTANQVSLTGSLLTLTGSLLTLTRSLLTLTRSATQVSIKLLSRGVTRKRRCTYRPSVIYLIANKVLSLSLSLTLSPSSFSLSPHYPSHCFPTPLTFTNVKTLFF